MTTLQALHTALIARDNCRKANNPYADAWTEQIATLMEYGPSGAGIDRGIKLLAWTARRVRFSADFHHMSESGMYDGWTEHVVTIAPTFTGFDVTISGRNRNDIKDYIGQTFQHWLSQNKLERLNASDTD